MRTWSNYFRLLVVGNFGRHEFKQFGKRQRLGHWNVIVERSYDSWTRSPANEFKQHLVVGVNHRSNSSKNGVITSDSDEKAALFCYPTQSGFDSREAHPTYETLARFGCGDRLRQSHARLLVAEQERFLVARISPAGLRSDSYGGCRGG